MPEDEYGYWDSGPPSGGSPIRAAASNAQLSALTDVLHKMGIFHEDEKLLTVAALLGREISTLRALRVDEAETLLKMLGEPGQGDAVRG
jgi:hypothetical protein